MDERDLEGFDQAADDVKRALEKKLGSFDLGRVLYQRYAGAEYGDVIEKCASERAAALDFIRHDKALYRAIALRCLLYGTITCRPSWDLDAESLKQIAFICETDVQENVKLAIGILRFNRDKRLAIDGIKALIPLVEDDQRTNQMIREAYKAMYSQASLMNARWRTGRPEIDKSFTVLMKKIVDRQRPDDT